MEDNSNIWLLQELEWMHGDMDSNYDKTWLTSDDASRLGRRDDIRSNGPEHRLRRINTYSSSVLHATPNQCQTQPACPLQAGTSGNSKPPYKYLRTLNERVEDKGDNTPGRHLKLFSFLPPPPSTHSIVGGVGSSLLTRPVCRKEDGARP